MCEILAPAGDEKSFFAAIGAGANAVYLGLSDFSARKNAANFSLDNLKKYIEFAHVFKVKVYVAMNTLVKDDELDSFTSCLVAAHNLGADAIIMQDIFLGKLIKERYPEITLHLSTQSGCCNIYGARMAKRYGFSRVILARETPFTDIKEIASVIETEVFVQGALCTCFSGQCYLSAFAGGNSGNRGYCKQPCRKQYKIDGNGCENYAYSLSLSDLCLGEKILELKQAGVASFKIEGRMRSPEYVQSAVAYYRDILSCEPTRAETDFISLKRSFNRGGYTSGYLEGQDKNLLSRDIQNHIGEKIGTIRGSGKILFVESAFKPSVGDGFKVVRKGKMEIGGFVYSEKKPPSKKGFYIPNISDFKEGDDVHITSDTSLKCAEPRKVAISLKIRTSAGEKLSVTALGGFGKFSLDSEFCAESAKSSAIDEAQLKNCFRKTDWYPFEVSFTEIEIGESVFVLKSQLNSFRRAFYAKLFAVLSADARTQYVFQPLSPHPVKGNNTIATAVIDSRFEKNDYKCNPPEILIFKPENYKNLSEINDFLRKAKYYVTHKLLYVSAFTVGKDIENIRKIAEPFDGLYCEGYFGIELGKELKMPVFTGTGLNAFNRADVAVLQSEGVESFAVSKELSFRELEKMSEYRGAFVFAGGNIKVMDLGHCPFARVCGACARRNTYVMTDESGRKFPLHRYENSVCRFELYNCAPLVCGRDYGARLFDFTALSSESKRAYLDRAAGESVLKSAVGNYTAGLMKSGVR